MRGLWQEADIMAEVPIPVDTTEAVSVAEAALLMAAITVEVPPIREVSVPVPFITEAVIMISL